MFGKLSNNKNNNHLKKSYGNESCVKTSAGKAATKKSDGNSLMVKTRALKNLQ